MQLIDQRLYPPGETYYGEAINEIDYFEFLKTYNVDDAVGIIFSAIEQAAEQQGYILLRTSIYYESGTLYHLFNVKYYFVPILSQSISSQTGISGTGAIMSTPGFAIPGALIWIVAIIIVGIVGYILVRSFNLSINSVQYSPTGPGGETPPWSPLMYGVILFGAAFVLNALTGLTKQVKRY